MLKGFHNAPAAECLVLMPIGVAPKGSILGASALEIEQFSGLNTSKN